MRNWINLFENAQLPEMLFHGTPTEGLIGIFLAGKIEHRAGIDRGHHGVSFTSDIDTAKQFAHYDGHEESNLYIEALLDIRHDRAKTGAVIYCHSANLGRIEAYDDSDGDDLEREWRTYGDVPLAAISSIALIPDEIRAYRDDYLKAREMIDFNDSLRDHMSSSYRESMQQWLHDDRILAAIDAILSSPLLVAWPI